MQARYTRALIVGVVAMLPLFVFFRAVPYLFFSAIDVGTFILAAMLLIIAPFSLIGIAAVACAGRHVRDPGDAGNVGAVASMSGIVFTLAIMIVVAAIGDLGYRSPVLWPDILLTSITNRTINSFSIYLVPTMICAGISALSGHLYFRYWRPGRTKS